MVDYETQLRLKVEKTIEQLNKLKEEFPFMDKVGCYRVGNTLYTDIPYYNKKSCYEMYRELLIQINEIIKDKGEKEIEKIKSCGSQCLLTDIPGMFEDEKIKRCINFLEIALYRYEQVIKIEKEKREKETAINIKKEVLMFTISKLRSQNPDVSDLFKITSRKNLEVYSIDYESLIVEIIVELTNLYSNVCIRYFTNYLKRQSNINIHTIKTFVTKFKEEIDTGKIIIKTKQQILEERVEVDAKKRIQIIKNESQKNKEEDDYEKLVQKKIKELLL